MKNILPLDTKVCKICKSSFKKKVNVSRKKWEKTFCCSLECSKKSLFGRTAWNKGVKIDRTKFPTLGHFKKHTVESKKIMADAIKNWRESVGEDVWKEKCREGQRNSILSGIKNNSFHGTLGKKKELSATWLGTEATYNSKHRWIQKNWTKTGICQKCGDKPHPYGKRHFGTEWHSLDGCYNREDISTWVEVCKKCHNILDKYAT